MGIARFDDATLRDAVAGLNALPMSVSSLATVTGSPDFEFADVVGVVERDMVLAGGVLRVANSAESSAVARVETVRDAVVRIGPARTLAAAMHTVVAGRLQAPLEAYGIGTGELGRHSSGAWIAAELIRTCVRSSVQLPPSVGTAALLHDVGKLVCNTLAVDAGIDGALREAEDDLCAIERSLFGLDHAEIGARVATQWNLPPAIVAGIRAHHAVTDDPIAVAVALADDIAHDLVRGDFRDESGTARRSLLLGMPEDALAGIVVETASRLDAFDLSTAPGRTR